MLLCNVWLNCLDLDCLEVIPFFRRYSINSVKSGIDFDSKTQPLCRLSGILPTERLQNATVLLSLFIVLVLLSGRFAISIDTMATHLQGRIISPSRSALLRQQPLPMLGLPLHLLGGNQRIVNGRVA